MAPNKQWMQLIDKRLDDAYIIGVQKFVDFAFRRTGETDEIRCPCVKCCNTTPGTRKTVREHLIVYGIIQNYTFWYHHGERFGEPESDSEFEDDDDEPSDSEFEDDDDEPSDSEFEDDDDNETGSDEMSSEELKYANFSEAELLDEWNALQTENQLLRRRIDYLEREYERLSNEVFGKPSSPTS